MRCSAPPRRALTIALVHATAYSDDQQMLTYLARALKASGATTHLASPAHLRWRERRAWLETDWWSGPLDLVVRFLSRRVARGIAARLRLAQPVRRRRDAGEQSRHRAAHAEQALPARLGFAGNRAARLAQPAARDARPARRPVARATMAGCSSQRSGASATASASRESSSRVSCRGSAARRRGTRARGVAQRRFTALPLVHDGVAHDGALHDGAARHPCLGVYTIDGRVAGAYGRVASRPLIDGRAQDAAVLVVPPAGGAT